MLSILFSAIQQTQKPFITRLLKKTKEYKSIGKVVYFNAPIAVPGTVVIHL